MSGYRYSRRVIDFRRVLRENKRMILVLSFIVLLSASLYSRQYLLRRSNVSLKFVSGTAYISGEKGQVIIRLSDGMGSPINDADCNATVLYPDKTYFLVDIPMSGSSIEGNYYIDFITPSKTGIYEEIVMCSVEVSGERMTLDISSSFQVSIALNMIMEMSRNQTEKFSQVISEMESLKSDMESMSGKMDDIEGGINETNRTLTGKFDSLYSDWKNISDTMSSVFSV